MQKGSGLFLGSEPIGSNRGLRASGDKDGGLLGDKGDDSGDDSDSDTSDSDTDTDTTDSDSDDSDTKD